MIQVEEGMRVHHSGGYTPSCFPHCYQSFWSPGMRRVWGWLLGGPRSPGGDQRRYRRDLIPKSAASRGAQQALTAGFSAGLARGSRSD